MRTDKVINGLKDFCESKDLKVKLVIKEKQIIIGIPQPKIWETLVYPIPVTALWIWYLIDESKEMSSLLLLSALTIYFIWIYFEIARGINEITIDFENNEVEVKNLDRLCRHLYKSTRFRVEPDNKVFKKKKSFSRLSKNFRIFINSKDGILTLLDIDDDYVSDKFKSALTFLMTTKHAPQQSL